MTVAADRAHLSEDLKSFTEAERYEGKRATKNICSKDIGTKTQ